MKSFKTLLQQHQAYQKLKGSQILIKYLTALVSQYEILIKFSNQFLHQYLPQSALLKFLVRKTVFFQYCGGETAALSLETVQQLEKQKIYSILDYSVESGVSHDDFQKNKEEIIRSLELRKTHSALSFGVFKLSGLFNKEILEKKTFHQKLTADEEKSYQFSYGLVNEIIEKAVSLKHKIFIDAEESFIQGEIDVIAEHFMKKMNQNHTWVFTTVQMYRHDRLVYLENLLKTAQNEKYFVGIKMVRGAYIEKEQAYATQTKRPYALYAHKSLVDQAFREAIQLCLKYYKVMELCLATHNIEDTEYLLNELVQKNLGVRHPHFYFAQLLGMCDPLSYALSQLGAHTSKYVPYGPVQYVLPYLLRRLEENKGVKGQLGREERWLKDEVLRRVFFKK